jgi:6-phosphofructo-2-kinase
MHIRVSRYLSFFLSVNVSIFNVCEYRAKYCSELQDAEWFDPTNLEAKEKRSHCNRMAIQDMLDFFLSNPNGVSILDSTNPTHDRRLALYQKMKEIGVKVMFIEVCLTV